MLTDRTRWVAVTHASNAVGTIPDLRGIVAAAHAAGARVYVDAVHAAPHRRIDVAALGCDALACSAYKWFGPHVGVQWARPELLAELAPDKLLPSPDTPARPLGERHAAVRGAGRRRGGRRRTRADMDWDAVRAHEDALLAGALEGLDALPERDPPRPRPRPHLDADVHRRRPAPRSRSAATLAEREVAVWHGNYYAWELERFLGLAPDGAVRAGFVHYNDERDLERLLDAVEAL